MSKFSKKEKEEIIQRILAKSNTDKLPPEAKSDMSFKEKKDYWLKKFFILIRQTADSTDNYLQIFNRGNYEKWKSEESDMDSILEHIADAIDNEYNGNGLIKEEINKRLNYD